MASCWPLSVCSPSDQRAVGRHVSVELTTDQCQTQTTCTDRPGGRTWCVEVELDRVVRLAFDADGVRVLAEPVDAEVAARLHDARARAADRDADSVVVLAHKVAVERTNVNRGLLKALHVGVRG